VSACARARVPAAFPQYIVGCNEQTRVDALLKCSPGDRETQRCEAHSSDTRRLPLPGAGPFRLVLARNEGGPPALTSQNVLSFLESAEDIGVGALSNASTGHI